MGASFLLAECKLPAGFGDHPETGIALLRQRAASLTVDDLIPALQVMGLDDDADSDQFAEDLSNLRSLITEALDLIAGGGDRVTAVSNERIYTGGISYGDSPTESFDAVQALAESSAAAGPHLWLDTTEPVDLNGYATGTNKTMKPTTTLHLSAAQARELRDQLDYILATHYQGDASLPEPGERT